MVKLKLVHWWHHGSQTSSSTQSRMVRYYQSSKLMVSRFLTQLSFHGWATKNLLSTLKVWAGSLTSFQLTRKLIVKVNLMVTRTTWKFTNKWLRPWILLLKKSRLSKRMLVKTTMTHYHNGQWSSSVLLRVGLVLLRISTVTQSKTHSVLTKFQFRYHKMTWNTRTCLLTGWSHTSQKNCLTKTVTQLLLLKRTHQKVTVGWLWTLSLTVVSILSHLYCQTTGTSLLMFKHQVLL